MRILFITDPGILVPPSGYGGIERIVGDLAVEYIKMGFTVDLLTTKGSNIYGCSIHSIGNAGFPPTKFVMYASIFKAWFFLLRKNNQYDLIHNFGRLLYLFPVLKTNTRKIQSYQREITSRNAETVLKFNPVNLAFTGCSVNLITRANPLGYWKGIHNCVVFNKFQLKDFVNIFNAPLVFLGRIERIKGCHTAIEVAKITGRKLMIAGNISKLPEEIHYFENEIKPHIDGINIEFVGEVDDVQKNELLGMSAALLMPIEWNEPFGIVMIEAMACGTPVIAFPYGSVPEVVEEGITGFVVRDSQEMIHAVSRINQIDRSLCRQTAERRFDVSVIAKEYLSLFD
jgi:glycosyltransferase involved in cell wall biosynthesis